jgi:hypothetical protein
VLCRDKFITHLPPDMLIFGSGWSSSVPLDFHIDHARRREVSEAELRQLRDSVREIERDDALELGGDEPDPRPNFRRLVKRLDGLKAENAQVIKNLMRHWGVVSPLALDVARSLNDVLEIWANLFVEKVGIRDGTASGE